MRRIRVKSVGFWLLGMATAVLIIWGFGNGFSVVASTPNSLAQQAADLTQQGHQQMAVGQPEEALERWKDAEEKYKEIGNAEGIAGSQINQSLALQAMGQSRQACKTLLEVLNLDTVNHADANEDTADLCDAETEKTVDLSQFSLSSLNMIELRSLKTIGLRNLGDVLRAIGNLEESEVVLKQSLELFRNLEISGESETLLSLGNTYRALYDRQRNLLDLIESHNDRTQEIERTIEQAEEALTTYKNVTEPARTQARLNSLSLLLEVDRWLKNLLQSSRSEYLKERLKKEQIQIHDRIPILVNEIQNNLPSLDKSSSIENIEIYLNFAESLSKLNNFDNNLEEDYLNKAIAYLEVAVQQADALNYIRAKANANGILGYLYEQHNNFDLARKFTELAVIFSQSIQAPDIAYQWQHQLGRIYQKQGNTQQAILVYETAVDSLDLVRQDLLTLDPNSGFSFRENVKPIYEELLALHLNSSALSKESQKKAIEVNERFQIAELENFLRCNLLNYKSNNREQKESDTIPDLTVATLHIIVLENTNKIVEILGFGVGDNFEVYRYHTLLFSEVRETLNELRNTIKQRTSSQPPPTIDEWNKKITPSSQALYQAIVAPIISQLPIQVKTIHFVLDNAFQNIPMSILQDEAEHYLIENYSITTRLISGEKNSETRSLPLNSIIAAGLSEKNHIPDRAYERLKIDPSNFNFNALPHVSDELKEISKSIEIKTKLLNREFTVDRLVNAVNHSRSPIVHIATHGQFSSDPKQTFLLADDEFIVLQQLDRLLRNRTEKSLNPIELLVLSACQTAKDDKSGGLGLAGIAVKAGARNVVASLWNISDRSTVYLMKEFYAALNAGQTKAEALRHAQLTLIAPQSPELEDYKNPYYWGAFILASS
jgi:CHAT domain-containing protein